MYFLYFYIFYFCVLGAELEEKNLVRSESNDSENGENGENRGKRSPMKMSLFANSLKSGKLRLKNVANVIKMGLNTVATHAETNSTIAITTEEKRIVFNNFCSEVKLAGKRGYKIW